MTKAKISRNPQFTVDAANEMHRIAMLNDLSAESYKTLVHACKLYATSESCGIDDKRKVLCGDVTTMAETLGYRVD